MAISRKKKEELVEKYTDLLNNSQGVIVTEYRGMNMDQINTVRGKLREIDATYMVTKNTLFKLALENAGMVVPDELLEGPVAVAFAKDDVGKAAKIALDLKDSVQLFVVKGALMGETAYTSENDVETLSKLPTLEEIRANLVGLLIAPATGLVSVLVAPSQELVNVLDGGTKTLVNVLAAYANKQDDEAA